ncbi:NicO-domain-containing protein [Cystobasidium minutum MCA 4210]|uniref:NicO-domain-containing protein n=1 Tax=Cystobasidium minutum MCA 4210 TaxID=1397322 RepID=UPI0034CE25BA|eukprot:jgi/Rhomi1/211703/estExt_Genemark1.C_5_t10244
MLSGRRLTLAGKSYLLVSTLVLINLIVWLVAIGLFAASGRSRVLSLASIAYTLGLRHALDADHISAIDNATRQLVARGQRPLTCGLFFSLGHSTIVIAVTLAVAISISVANKLDPVSSVGGIVGISVSASFLFLLAIINSVILYKILKDRRKAKAGITTEPSQVWGCMGRIARPLLKLIDKPWKLYPIGILFGFGFDTASEITLLGVSAVAIRPHGGGQIKNSEIIILPALFTSGMALVDSLDSILMLWGYAMPKAGEENWKILWKKRNSFGSITEKVVLDDTKEEAAEAVSSVEPTTLREPSPEEIGVINQLEAQPVHSKQSNMDAEKAEKGLSQDIDAEKGNISAEDEPIKPIIRPAKAELYSELSIVLTLISILVAFAISIIEFMGIALEKCTSCAEAAENSSGLDGRWWRFWEACNDSSGYIGAGIVGVMLLCGAIFLGLRRYRRKKAERSEKAENVEAVVIGS